MFCSAPALRTLPADVGDARRPASPASGELEVGGLPNQPCALSRSAHSRGLSYCICGMERRQEKGAFGVIFASKTWVLPAPGQSGRQKGEDRAYRPPLTHSASGAGEDTVQGWCARWWTFC